MRRRVVVRVGELPAEVIALAVANLDHWQAFLREAATRTLEHSERDHGGFAPYAGHFCVGDETLDALERYERTGEHGGLYVLAMAAISEIAKHRREKASEEA